MPTPESLWNHDHTKPIGMFDEYQLMPWDVTCIETSRGRSYVGNDTGDCIMRFSKSVIENYSSTQLVDILLKANENAMFAEILPTDSAGSPRWWRCECGDLASDHRRGITALECSVCRCPGFRNSRSASGSSQVLRMDKTDVRSQAGNDRRRRGGTTRIPRRKTSLQE